MQPWMVLAVVWSSVVHGGGVTEHDDEISKRWAEDFKTLSHIYARTSDKDLYGASLPPPITFNAATTSLKADDFYETQQFAASDLLEDSQIYPYMKTIPPKRATSSSYFSLNNLKPYQNGDEKFGYSDNLRTQKEYSNLERLKSKFEHDSNGSTDGETYKSVQNFTHVPNIWEAGDITTETGGTYRKKETRSKFRFINSNPYASTFKCSKGICRIKSKISTRPHIRPLKKIKTIVYNN
ncbi:uncharacterized protein [Battus philenor]|uniref:uncharacterized protein n=1 Tax=Battus philenor TaxID=42288 RepID=UPI0035CF24B7